MQVAPSLLQRRAQHQGLAGNAATRARTLAVRSCLRNDWRRFSFGHGVEHGCRCGNKLVVIGNGMVGQRLPRAAGGGRTGPFEITVLGEEPRAAYDRVQLSASSPARRPTICPWCRRASCEQHGIDAAPQRRAPSAIDRDAQVRAHGAGAELAVRQAGARHRLVSVRAAGARTRAAGLLRLPHDRRSRSDPRGAARREGRRRDRRRPARPGSGEGAARPRPGDARRRVRAAPDGRAGRRRRRRAAARRRSKRSA